MAGVVLSVPVTLDVIVVQEEQRERRLTLGV
jgi:hypothetical protein